MPRIEASAASKERVAAELAKLAPVKKAAEGPRRDGKQWARNLVARIDAGHKATRTVGMQAKIIDRWQQLEGQVAAPVLPSYAAALRQLAD